MFVSVFLSACVADPWPEPDEATPNAAGGSEDDSKDRYNGADGGMEKDASVGEEGTGTDPADSTEKDDENGGAP